MKQLLTVAMSEAQVREACKEYAEKRTAVMEPCTVSVTFVAQVRTSANHPDGAEPPPSVNVRAEVVFMRKRVRAEKANENTVETQ